jgi:hypothetical protein
VLLPPPDSAIESAALFLDGTPTAAGSTASAAQVPIRRPALYETIAARLYYVAGSATPVTRALDGFRLVSESSARPGAAPFRLFERVPGARVSVQGARPGAPVVARVWLQAGGRAVEWRSDALADPDGAAMFRLPYATGGNGAIVASEYLVSDGAASASLALAEHLVLAGERVEIRLGGPARHGSAR